MTRPKKKWGQNFLRNRGAVEKIVAAVEPGRVERLATVQGDAARRPEGDGEGRGALARGRTQR